MPKKTPKRQLVPRTRNAGTWTEAEYWNRVSSILRRGFMWWKPISACRERGKRKAVGKGRLKWEYHCEGCGGWFPRKQINIDHVVAVGKIRSYEDVGPALERLTAEGEGAFQRLCKECHQKRTNEQRKKT